jgi:alanine-alpha-ketoisovalerate/valine-pyruvate aminotransferase
MKMKTAILVTEDNLLTDLAFHNVPSALLIEFSEKIVRPYYRGSLTAAIQDLLQKALSEQEIVSSHTTHVQNSIES